MRSDEKVDVNILREIRTNLIAFKSFILATMIREIWEREGREGKEFCKGE
jgi:hypothetical protein